MVGILSLAGLTTGGLSSTDVTLSPGNSQTAAQLSSGWAIPLHMRARHSSTAVVVAVVGAVVVVQHFVRHHRLVRDVRVSPRERVTAVGARYMLLGTPPHVLGT